MNPLHDRGFTYLCKRNFGLVGAGRAGKAGYAQAGDPQTAARAQPEPDGATDLPRGGLTSG
jgi:hypothetical protein